MRIMYAEAVLSCKHGNEDICCPQGNEIVITMHDDGKSFNPSNVKQPNLKANLSERQIGGLGLYLMRKLMDKVQYESTPGEGNLLTMRKRRG